MYTGLSLESVLNLSKTGVFGLINEIDRKIYVSYSSNILWSINESIKSNKILKDDVQKLSIKIFDSNHDKLILKQFTMSIINEYKNKGYELYRKYNHIKYKIEIDLVDEYAYVTLYSNNGNKSIVGIFDDIDEANLFVSQYYPNKFVIPNLIANNIYTRIYYSKRDE